MRYAAPSSRAAQRLIRPGRRRLPKGRDHARVDVGRHTQGAVPEHLGNHSEFNALGEQNGAAAWRRSWKRKRPRPARRRSQADAYGTAEPGPAMAKAWWSPQLLRSGHSRITSCGSLRPPCHGALGASKWTARLTFRQSRRSLMLHLASRARRWSAPGSCRGARFGQPVVKDLHHRR